MADYSIKNTLNKIFTLSSQLCHNPESDNYSSGHSSYWLWLFFWMLLLKRRWYTPFQFLFKHIDIVCNSLCTFFHTASSLWVLVLHNSAHLFRCVIWSISTSLTVVYVNLLHALTLLLWLEIFFTFPVSFECWVGSSGPTTALCIHSWSRPAQDILTPRGLLYLVSLKPLLCSLAVSWYTCNTWWKTCKSVCE